MEVIKYMMKVFLAGLLAITILNLLCLVYHCKPLPIDVTDGATPTKYESNIRYSIMHEGWGRGKINDDGYNNVEDFQNIEHLDALLMGSSQMEGLRVAQKDTTAAVLNSLAGEELYTYNVGISGHNFYACVRDLDAALTAYVPEKFAIIELSTVEIGNMPLGEFVDKPAEVHAESDGIVGFLKSIPYIRLLAIQYADLQNKEADNNKIIVDSDEAVPVVHMEVSVDCDNTRDILSYIAATCAGHQVRPVLFLYQPVMIDRNGEGYTQYSLNQVEAFAGLCEDYGIEFVDTTEDFLGFYRETYKLPTGFANTLPGTGHLNKYGHKIIAEDLHERLSALMEDK